jgi:DnaJ-class molecular chaperone
VSDQQSLLSMGKDYYNILGVSRNADQKELKKLIENLH